MTQNLSDAQAITQYEENLQKGSIAKIISQDRHLPMTQEARVL